MKEVTTSTFVSIPQITVGGLVASFVLYTLTIRYNDNDEEIKRVENGEILWGMTKSDISAELTAAESKKNEEITAIKHAKADVESATVVVSDAIP